jgi:acyl-coenzyme A thioesterase PaaI-like protein
VTPGGTVLDGATEARVRASFAALTTMPADREVLTVDFSANVTAPAAGERFRGWSPPCRRR